MCLFCIHQPLSNPRPWLLSVSGSQGRSNTIKTYKSSCQHLFSSTQQFPQFCFFIGRAKQATFTFSRLRHWMDVSQINTDQSKFFHHGFKQYWENVSVSSLAIFAFIGNIVYFVGGTKTFRMCHKNTWIKWDQLNCIISIQLYDKTVFE